MNHKLFRIAPAAVIAACAMTLPSLATAQDKSPPAASTAQAMDLADYLCKDIMRMSGEDRIISLSLLNGYFLGKKGTTRFAPGSMGKASDEFTEYCLDNPQAKALDAFAKFAK